MNCEVSDCNAEATGCATYCHPDPKMRWSAALCDAHKLEAFSKATGKGELVFGPEPLEIAEVPC